MDQTQYINSLKMQIEALKEAEKEVSHMRAYSADVRVFRDEACDIIRGRIAMREAEIRRIKRKEIK
jgi:hypothetical protein